MGSLMLSFWFKEQSVGRRRVIIIGLVMLLAAVIINQLAQHLMPVKRASPSLSFTDITKVSDDLIPHQRCFKRQFPGRSRDDAADICVIYVALFWPPGVCYRAGNIRGVRFPTRDDWRPLVYRYCRRLINGSAHEAPLGIDDLIER